MTSQYYKCEYISSSVFLLKTHEYDIHFCGKGILKKWQPFKLLNWVQPLGPVWNSKFCWSHDYFYKKNWTTFELKLLLFHEFILHFLRPRGLQVIPTLLLGRYLIPTRIRYLTSFTTSKTHSPTYLYRLGTHLKLTHLTYLGYS